MEDYWIEIGSRRFPLRSEFRWITTSPILMPIHWNGPRVIPVEFWMDDDISIDYWIYTYNNTRESSIMYFDSHNNVMRYERMIIGSGAWGAPWREEFNRHNGTVLVE